MTAANQMAAQILAKVHTVNGRVRYFDRAVTRFSKAELQDVARGLGLDTNGTRSAICYRVARFGLD